MENLFIHILFDWHSFDESAHGLSTEINVNWYCLMLLAYPQKMYQDNWPLALERFLILVELSIQNLMVNQPLAPHLGLSNTKLAVVSFFHAVTESDICHQHMTRSSVCWDTLFPKRKQEVRQDQCHINRISMTVYFSFNVYQSSHDPYFNLRFSVKMFSIRLWYVICYLITMLTSQLIFYPIRHNTIRCCFVCVGLFCCEVEVIVSKFYKLAVILTVQNDALKMTPQQNITCDPELTELTRNHRTWCMLLRSKYCTRTQCCRIWLTCKTFQRYVSLKYVKVWFIGIIITIVSDVFSLVTRNYPTVCTSRFLV